MRRGGTPATLVRASEGNSRGISPDIPSLTFACLDVNRIEVSPSGIAPVDT